MFPNPESRTRRSADLSAVLPVVFAASTALVLAATAIAQDPPVVRKLLPAHDSVEVDAKQTRTLVVEFDQPMSRSGFSICGGGPAFPKVSQRPQWRDAKTLVVEVELVPDHTYRMSLNCPAARNFRSAKGVELRPVPWSFTTLPEKLPDPVEQRARNEKAFTALQEMLASDYSYYELKAERRQLDWNALFGKHRDEVLAARTTRGWASRVAHMLAVTGDIHMHLEFEGGSFAAGSRAVDPLYRPQLLQKHVGSITEPAPGVLTARTGDGILYLMIPGFTKQVDFDAVEQWIDAQREVACKALVIDVRPNAGGDELLAQRVARWFVPGTRTYAKHVTRNGKGADGFHPPSERRIAGRPDRERFGRPVVVLMSRYCMSSCEAFLLMMKQAEQCTLLGQRSFGSSGNPRPHDLQNGVRLFLPSWRAMTPDGACFEDIGIAPDVEVPATSADFEKDDPILAQALARLRRK